MTPRETYSRRGNRIRSSRQLPPRFPGLVRAIVVLPPVVFAACGGDDPAGPGGPGPGNPDNVPPTVAAIADQTVPANTLTPSTFVIDLVIEDPDDDSFNVTAVSDDAAVIPPTKLTCGADPCRLSLTPLVTASATVAVTVTVTDGGGGEASTTFAVHVAPRLVTSTEDDGPGSLRRVIADSDPGDVIGFDTEGAFGSPQTIGLLSQLVLDDDRTIEGPGAGSLTVSGNNLARVFRVDGGADVRLSGLTMADGVAPVETFEITGGPFPLRLGGCVLVTSAGRLTLEAAVLTGCAAPAGGQLAAGGGIANFEGTLIVRDTEITGNSADNGGGGIMVLGLGAEAATTIEGGEITQNTAAGSGGGVGSLEGSLLVLGSRIANNMAPDGGGLANNQGSLTIEPGTEVTDNVATGQGGGIHQSGGILTIDGATIAENTAERGGGLGVDGGSASLTGTSIDGNTAASGGGVYNAGVLEILADSRLSNNAATGASASGGGGILNAGNAELAESLVGQNTSAGAGGGIRNLSGSRLTLDAAILLDNTAASGGGGIFNEGELETAASTVRGNRADSDGNGSGDGGGIANREPGASPGTASALVRTSLVEDNTAANGGGIGNSGGLDAQLTLEGSEVRGNTAAKAGGGVHSTGVLVVNETTVSANFAAGELGGDGGGGIRIDGGQLEIRSSSIEANAIAASGNGGGLHLSSGAEALIDGVSITDNTAFRGGGVYVSSRGPDEPASIVIRNGSLVARNTAVAGINGLGGGIHLSATPDADIQAEIRASAISENTAGKGGGVIVGGGSLLLASSTIADNAAIVEAGGLLVDGASVSVVDGSEVMGNRAGGSGGGFLLNGATLTVTGTTCMVHDNLADDNADGSGTGGGIFALNGSDISGVPAARVCDNAPNDIVP